MRPLKRYSFVSRMGWSGAIRTAHPTCGRNSQPQGSHAASTSTRCSIKSRMAAMLASGRTDGLRVATCVTSAPGLAADPSVATFRRERLLGGCRTESFLVSSSVSKGQSPTIGEGDE